jgi:hypothetical protein
VIDVPVPGRQAIVVNCGRVVSKQPDVVIQGSKAFPGGPIPKANFNSMLTTPPDYQDVTQPKKYHI